MRELCDGKFYEFRKRTYYDPEHDYFYDVEKKIFFSWWADGNYYHGYTVKFYVHYKESLVEAYEKKYGIPEEIKIIKALEEAPLSEEEKQNIKMQKASFGEDWPILRLGGEFQGYEPDYSFNAAIIPKEYV